MKIFEIITSVNLGGAENFTFNLVDQCTLLNPNQFEFIIVELFSSNNFYALRKKAELKAKGIRVISLSKFGKRTGLFIAPFFLLRNILKEKPDVIHSHSDLPDFVLGLVMNFIDTKMIKIVRTIHNTELWSEYYQIGKFVESFFVNDYVIGVSVAAKSSYENLRLKYKLPVSNKISVIYNGCSIPGKKSHPFKIDKNKINIAFCGRFVYQKGIDILVKVISELKADLSTKFLFHIVGDGPNKNIVTELVNKSKNVILYAPVSNLSEKLYEFDYLLMPSRFEGLPLISIESFLSKVPVIAANSPGLNETIPASWPLLFEIDEEYKLKDILLKIANFDFDKEELRNSSFEFAIETFSIKTMAIAYSEIYLD